MALATVYARALAGVDARPVTIEIDIVAGLPGFIIVGLAETAVKEARHRVFGAIINSQFEFPRRKIIVSLSPADLPKSGGCFDLAIAMGILAASQQCPAECLTDFEFHAELSLTGELRSAPGVLQAANAAKQNDRALLLSVADAGLAAWVAGAHCYGAKTLVDVVAHVMGRQLLGQSKRQAVKRNRMNGMDLADVRGQVPAKRALEIAASGGHGLLFKGPPGTGKTLLASRLAGLLPALSESDALQVAMVQSLTASGFNPDSWGQRPFRSPHHSASVAAIVGGGNPPRPGEISLAHGGVLFLDELPEFQRSVLEALREPLESGEVTISRAQTQVTYPAKMQWVAAMNPCPCGYANDERVECQCSEEQIRRYQQRLSGPLLDRIDLHVNVMPQTLDVMWQQESQSESSQHVAARVKQVRQRQQQRGQVLNALLSPRQLTQVCDLSKKDQQWLNKAAEHQHLSARRFHRVLRVARTIADMVACEAIGRDHLAEALSYQPH